MTAAALLLAFVAAAQPHGVAGSQPPQQPEVTSLDGRPLLPPATIANREEIERQLDIAESAYNQMTPEVIITRGRLHAYLWQYSKAIATFSEGIARHPADGRLYRHRGHRYITTRQFAKAQADLEKAASLIAGRPDQAEPVLVAPPASGASPSMLHFNVWYHLGLAHFLQGHYDQALDAYTKCLAVATNDDALVAVSDWRWMTLMRLGRTADAARVLERISPQMDIHENGAYHRRLLMYKGLLQPSALLDTANADDTTIATQGFGVANYYLVTGEAARARALFERIVAGAGWNAFGYIAAEAELAR